MTVHELVLDGCTPEPLMSYLKALGVLRIVAEQRDPSARGSWRDGRFTLRSTLGAEALAEFFDSEAGYQPTPIFAPWNGEGGFLTETGASHDTVDRFRHESSPRLARLREAVERIDGVSTLRDFGVARDRVKELEKKKLELRKANRNLDEADADELGRMKKKVKQIKGSIILSIRAGFPDEVVRWLDTCMALTPDAPVMAPLLGSGGCDGRLEFSANYLGNVLLFMEREPDTRRAWVEHALFARGDAKLVDAAIGQFSPGSSGGPNATQGFEGDSAVNPFEFVLMIEGSLVLAGAATRKYGIEQSPKGAFPFTVYSSPVGYGSRSEGESKGSRGELWMPLWSRPASLAEVAHVFSEGRAELSRKQATSGVELARAIASLGVDRGVSGFSRYGLLPRNGRAYLATPIGRFAVNARPDVDLIREADRWLDAFRGVIAGSETPSLRTALRAVETAIFEYCEHGGSSRFARILGALGRAERDVAVREKLRKKMRPLSGLSSDWLRAANDGSVELELAVAAAGIHDRAPDGLGPLRTNLEPVDSRRWPAWAKSGRSDVWSNADLPSNLLAVLERRLLDSERRGAGQSPLAHGPTASLAAVSAFIAGETDDDRLEALLWGAVLVDRVGAWRALGRGATDAPPLPREFALLRLVFASSPLETPAGPVYVRPERAALALLRANRVGEACAVSTRRLQASGLRPMANRGGRTPATDAEWTGGGADPRRIAAALLFPLGLEDLRELMRLVLRPAPQDELAAVQQDGRKERS